MYNTLRIVICRRLLLMPCKIKTLFEQKLQRIRILYVKTNWESVEEKKLIILSKKINNRYYMDTKKMHTSQLD